MYEELIASTRFTSEDLFALMGGFDTLWMVCPLTMTGPDDPKLLRKYDKWRRNAVRRHSKSGLVDDACNPCDELRIALEPLRGPSLVTWNGPCPDDPGQGDERTRGVYVLPDGRATAVRRGSGFFGGWYIRPLASEGQILEAVLTLCDLLGQICPMGAARRVIVPPDPGFPWVNATLWGTEEQIRSTTSRWAFDPAPLLALSRWWSEDGKAAWETGNAVDVMRGTVAMDGPIASWVYDRVAPVRPVMTECFASDNRECEIELAHGISTGLPDRSSRYRATTIWPDAGMCLSLERAPAIGDPLRWYTKLGQEREFGAIDILASEEQLARTLLMVDEFPTGGNAVTYEGDGIPLWRMGGDSCTRGS